jgi:Lon protease-like protein
METVRWLSLFPLNTVLFPGGRLPLRIFEPRYLSLVSDCLRQEVPFGVCLIREGREVGVAATPHDVGTLAHIIDWDRRPDGLLGITVAGGERFRIRSIQVHADQLTVAVVEPLEPEPELELPERYQPLARLTGRILDQLGTPYADMPTHYEDGRWVGYRLAELLPLEFTEKQSLLEMDDPLLRLQRLAELISTRLIQPG